MATYPFSSAASARRRLAPPRVYRRAAARINPMTLGFPFSSSEVNLQRSFLFERDSRSCRCRAAGPESEPPEKINPPTLSGVTSTFTRFQDTVQIFFAVLFWMSLFFWSSAWDGGNGGRKNKGSRFKK